ncbi:SprT family protein [Niallia taxi]|uniref:SprT family protein n=1 Tax=Niallia taxi TaxID=2499688 RepID=UPI0039824C01
MTDQELQLLVEELSNTHFKIPFMHKASFNPRLRTTGGRYLLNSHNIEINRKYLDELGMEELIGIIKHELCHYHLHINKKGYQHKDADFKNLLRKVEGPRFCSSLPQEKTQNKPKRTLIYRCQSCNQIYFRRKKVDMKKYVCGKCRGKLSLEEIRNS